jgi:hypothetical protein
VQDDSLAADFLNGREAATTADNVRFLEGLTGEQPAAAAQAQAVEAAIPKAKEKVTAEDRTKKGTVVGGLATQAVGGVRDAVVQGGKAVEDLTAWMREHTPLGTLPEGPKLQVKLPSVRKPEGVAEELTRGASQFLTGFIPLFKAAKGAGLGMGAAGAAAGAVTDFTVFDPNDKRVSNLINELAPALRTPLTDYLAADPNDSGAEGRFKNALEGLALGGVSEGLLRTAKLLKAARGVAKETMASERGALAGEAKAATEAAAESAPEIKMRPTVEVKKVTPEQAREFMAANPDAVGLGDRVLKVGWEQIGNQEQLTEVINKTTRAFRDNIETARRGKVSDEQLRVLARELDMPVEDFLGRRVGAALNAEQSLALVSLLGASAKRLRGLASEVAAGNLEARQAMLDQLGLHAGIQEQAFGARAEAGRALRVWGMNADGTIAHAAKLKEVAEGMGAPGAGGLDAERLAQMILTTDPKQLNKLTREATKPGWVDMANELWINALLSNPTTHVANFLSNALTAIWAIPERALAAQLSPRGQGVVSGEATQMLFGLIGGTWDGLRIAGKALREGTPVREGSKIEGFTRKGVSGANLGMSGDLGRAMDLVGTAVRTPSRFLMASDEFFKAINFRMEMNAQALRKATSEGLEGKAAARRTAELLQDPDFIKQVKPIAEEFAAYQTFQKELGAAGSAAMALRDSHPAFKLVMPFIKTPTNILKYVGERTPFLNRLSSEVRADLAAGGARADMARAKVQLGGMVMASTAVLASSGYITGKGPTDPNLRREWLEDHQPYSIKIGGTWYSYNRLDPLGAMLGMAADFAGLAGDLNEIDAGQLSAAMALSVSNNMLSKTYLTGLADVLEAIQSPVQDSAKTARKMIGSLLVPAGVAQTARYIDPVQREVNSVYDAVVARIPGYSSTLPAKMNLWAEPVKWGDGVASDIASPIYSKSADLKPVSDEIVRLGVSVSMPGKWVFGKRANQTDPLAQPSVKDGVPLEPAEYEKYVKLAAGYGLGNLPPLKEALAKLMESDAYKRQSDSPDGGKAMLLRERIYSYRAAAQAKLVAESPELQAQLERKTKGEAEALRPPGSTLIGAGRVPAPSSGEGVGDMLKDIKSGNLPATLSR